MTWGQGSTIPKRIKDQVRRRDQTCRLQYPGICTGRIDEFDHPGGLAAQGRRGAGCVQPLPRPQDRRPTPGRDRSSSSGAWIAVEAVPRSRTTPGTAQTMSACRLGWVEYDTSSYCHEHGGFAWLYGSRSRRCDRAPDPVVAGVHSGAERPTARP